MSTRLIRANLLRRRAGVGAHGGGGVGGGTAIGDQGASLPLAVAGDGLLSGPRIGNTYIPGASVVTATVNRPTWVLAHYLPKAGTVDLSYYIEAGANSHSYRVGLYAVTANAVVDMVDPNDVDGGQVRPTTVLAVAAQQTVASGSGAAWRLTTGVYTAPSAMFVAPFIWPANTASGMKLYEKTSGCATITIRGGSSSFAYASSGSPPSYSGTSMTVNTRREVIMELIFTPAALSASTLTATATATRGIRLTAPAVAGAERYRLEWRTSGGSYTTANVIQLPAGPIDYTHDDLAAATTYVYRLYAIEGPRDTLASAEASATTSGVRQATLELSPTLLTTPPENIGRGIHGIDRNPPGFEGVVAYTRQFEWGEHETRATAGATPSYTFSAVTSWLNAIPSGKLGWIRFRAYVPGLGNKCPAFVSAGLSAGGAAGTYGYIQSDGDVIPRWDACLPMMNAFIAAAGAALAGHSKLAIFDCQFMGHYGEWRSMGNFPPSISTMNSYTDAAFAAFPSQVMVTAMPDELDEAALVHLVDTYGATRTIWYRQDALGDPNGPTQIGIFYTNVSPKMRAVLRSPRTMLVGEHWGNGSTSDENWLAAEDEAAFLPMAWIGDANLAFYGSQTGAEQDAIDRQLQNAGYALAPVRIKAPQGAARGETFRLTVVWRNTGNAPVWPAWRPQLEIRPVGGGATIGSPFQCSRTLLGIIAGEQVTHQDAWTLSAGFAVGTYELHLRVPTTYSGGDDLRMAVNGTSGTDTNRTLLLTNTFTVV